MSKLIISNSYGINTPDVCNTIALSTGLRQAISETNAETQAGANLIHWVSPDQLSIWGEREDELKSILLYCNTDFAAGRYLAEGGGYDELDSLLKSWESSTQELIKYHAENIPNSVLVDIETVFSAPKKFAGAVSDILGLGCDHKKLTLNTELCLLVRLIAQVAVAERDDLFAVFDDLKSMATVLPKEYEFIDPYRQIAASVVPGWQKYIKMQNQTQQLLSENQGLQERLNRETSSINKNKETIHGLENKCQKLEQKVLELKSKLQQDSETAKKYLSEIKKLQNKGKITSKQEQQAERPGGSLANQNKALKEKLEEKEAELELALLQLDQLQEELEHYFIKYQEITIDGTKPLLPSHLLNEISTLRLLHKVKIDT